MGETYLHNPILLKIDLMLRGIRVSDEVWGKVGGNVDHLEGIASGIDIVLAKKTPVNVPCKEEFTKNSPYFLRSNGTNFYVADGSEKVDVGVIPRPAFYSKTTSTGIPFPRIGVVHGSYVAINPSRECKFFSGGMECKFCAAGLDSVGSAIKTYSVDEVLETVEAAHREGKAKLVYISISFSDSPDGGINFLRPYITAVKKHFRSLLAIEALPPENNKWVDETYAIGVDSVLYNIEIFDKELYDIICPGRARFIGRKRFIEALKYAATVFPNGTVASHLIVGLEPPGSTVRGIDLLTSIGVIPILPIYRPSPGKAHRIEPLTTEVIAPIYGHLYSAVKKKNINMNWIRDISVVTTPLEGRFIVNQEADGFDKAIQKFYKSTVGLKAAWGLATLRRKLRVRNKKDTQGSSDS